MRRIELRRALLSILVSGRKAVRSDILVENPSLHAAALAAITESVLITTATLDPPGPTILYVNPAFEIMTGYKMDEVIGLTPRILQGPATDRLVMTRMRSELERGGLFQGEAINYRKDGTTYVVEWIISAIRNSVGDVTHWVAAQRDVTQLRASADYQRVLHAKLLGRVNHASAQLRGVLTRARD